MDKLLEEFKQTMEDYLKNVDCIALAHNKTEFKLAEVKDNMAKYICNMYFIMDMENFKNSANEKEKKLYDLYKQITTDVGDLYYLKIYLTVTQWINLKHIQIKSYNGLNYNLIMQHQYEIKHIEQLDKIVYTLNGRY